MKMKNLSIGVVVPTKNRMGDFVRAIESIKRQTYLPQEIIIVDQSITDAIRAEIKFLLAGYGNIKLTYIFNPNLRGLTSAKNLAIKSSESDVLLFIDDDIILDEKFIEIFYEIYDKYPELDGLGGLIRLPGHKSSAAKRKIAIFFQIGPFRDTRAMLQAGYLLDKEIIPTWLLSGGLSSLRREVFEKVKFNDDLPGASPIEDFDFYSRASMYFQFALVPAAQALHNISPMSREGLKRSFEAKCAGFFYVFSKYIAKTGVNRIAFLWRNVGFFLDALLASFSYRTLEPLAGICSAWQKAIFKWNCR